MQSFKMASRKYLGDKVRVASRSGLGGWHDYRVSLATETVQQGRERLEAFVDAPRGFAILDLDHKRSEGPLVLVQHGDRVQERGKHFTR